MGKFSAQQAVRIEQGGKDRVACVEGESVSDS